MTSKFLIAAVVALLGSVAVSAQLTELCFLKGESTSGMNKTCFYNCPSGSAAFTIKSYELCSYSIQR